MPRARYRYKRSIGDVGVKLEVIFQRELNVTRSFRGLDLAYCAGIRIRCVNAAIIGCIKDRVVESVEEFSAEFKLLAFGDGEDLGKAAVDVLLTWSVH